MYRLKKKQGDINFSIKVNLNNQNDVKMQVAAIATVCSRLQKMAILIFQFRLI